MTCTVTARITAARYGTHPHERNPEKRGPNRDDLSKLIVTCEREDNGKRVIVELPNNGRRESTGEFRKLSGLSGKTVRLELDQHGSIVGAELEDE